MINILKHISFARDWLDRAEEEIKISSMVDGEVYLSLAEAEVRKAWESSYFPRKKTVRKSFHFNRKFLPAVLGILLLFMFVFVNYLYTPSESPEKVELKLIDEYTLGKDIYRGKKEIRLINASFMVENNNGRR